MTILPQTDQLTIHNVREHIIGIEQQVPLLDGSLRQYVNFDNAASTPALRPVHETITSFMQWYSSVHRGTGFKSQVATEAYDDAHEIVCEFVGADPETNVAIFSKNATESLNKLARRIDFQPGDVVLTTIMEHHSNDLPFRPVAEVKHINVLPDGRLDLGHLEALLNEHSVRLVCISGASNVTGIINPIHEVAEMVHIAGAEILVDTTQLAPHRAIDMLPDDDPRHIDYVVLSAHKMYAPYGSGALIGHRQTFLQGPPDLVGGGVVDIVTPDYVHWTSLPDREEAGSPNVVGAVAMARTMLALEAIGMEALAAHEAELTSRLLTGMNAIDGVTVYGDANPANAAERVGVVPFNIEGMSHFKVAAILSLEGGIGVRNGCFCAQPYLLHLLGASPEEVKTLHQKIIDGHRVEMPGMVRVSFGCYNTVEEVEHLLAVLERVAAGDYAGDYVQDPATGEFWEPTFPAQANDYWSLR